MEEVKKLSGIEEKEITRKNGMGMLVTNIATYVISIGMFILSIIMLDKEIPGVVTVAGGVLMAAAIVIFIVSIIVTCGFHVINPNEALVLTLFGEYYGTIKQSGFYHTNPFCCGINPAKDASDQIAITQKLGRKPEALDANIVVSGKKISTKIVTLNNEKQKVNDLMGNPIIIGAVVIWKVQNPTKAVLNVDNYMTYLSMQSDSTIRNIAKLYPYDVMDENEDGAEMTLRGSSLKIAEEMKDELQKKVEEAGIEILEVKITHLSYSEEIAAAMLQRQQATAIIAARQKIVEGAVSMVKMAIDQLGEEEIVVLDEERKAAMVSNLLVVLCGNKEAQPIVNSGSIY